MRTIGGWPTERWKSDAPLLRVAMSSVLSRFGSPCHRARTERLRCEPRRPRSPTAASRFAISSRMSSARVRTTRSGSFVRDLHQRLRHLRMIEVFQRLHDFDAHVGLRIGEHASERVQRARIADATEGFDGGPFEIGIGEHGDRAARRRADPSVGRACRRRRCGSTSPDLSAGGSSPARCADRRRPARRRWPRRARLHRDR